MDPASAPQVTSKVVPLVRSISVELALVVSVACVALAVLLPPSALVTGPILIVAGLSGAGDRGARSALTASGALLIVAAAATVLFLVRLQ